MIVYTRDKNLIINMHKRKYKSTYERSKDMRKKLIILFIILNLLTMTACSRNVSKDDENDKTAQNETIKQNENIDQPSNDDSIEEEPVEDDLDTDEDNYEADEDVNLITHEDNPLLELARKGRIDSIEFGIGSSTEEIIEEWGLPDDYDYFMGGLYFKYDDKNVLFFTSAAKENDEIIHGEVKCMGSFEENKEVFNVKIGMTFDEIIAILGEPTYIGTPEEHEDSELLYGTWAIVYDTEEYEIDFVTRIENGPVDTVYLWGKN